MTDALSFEPALLDYPALLGGDPFLEVFDSTVTEAGVFPDLAVDVPPMLSSPEHVTTTSSETGSSLATDDDAFRVVVKPEPEALTGRTNAAAESSPPQPRRTAAASSRKRSAADSKSTRKPLSSPGDASSADSSEAAVSAAVNEQTLKRQKRLQKNRESAHQSRQRRKQRMEELEQQVQQLVSENSQLKRDNQKLRAELDTLRQKLSAASASAPRSVSGSRAAKAAGLCLLVVLFSFGLLMNQQQHQQHQQLMQLPSQQTSGRALLSFEGNGESTALPPINASSSSSAASTSSSSTSMVPVAIADAADDDSSTQPANHSSSSSSSSQPVPAVRLERDGTLVPLVGSEQYQLIRQARHSRHRVSTQYIYCSEAQQLGPNEDSGSELPSVVALLIPSEFLNATMAPQHSLVEVSCAVLDMHAHTLPSIHPHLSQQQPQPQPQQQQQSAVPMQSV